MSARVPARPRVTWEVIDGAYTEELARLAIQVGEQYEQEQRTTGSLLRVGQQPLSVDDRPSMKTSAEYDALLEKATIRYTLQAIRRREWDDLKEAHPARRDPDPDDPESTVIHEADSGAGVNVDTFFSPDLIMQVIVDPDSDPYDPKPLFTAREAEDFCDDLIDTDWNGLCSTIWGLNERGSGIPRLSMGSSLRRRIDADSQQRETSESPSPVSRVGSPASSTPTETPTETPALPETPGESSSSESPSGTSSNET